MSKFVTARALIFSPDGQLLIVRRSAGDLFCGGKWDLPGGRAEDGETVEQTLAREVLEEVGIDNLQNPELVFATSAVRPNGTGTWIFFLEKLSTEPKIMLSHEHDEYKWINFEELPDYNQYEILMRMHQFVTENDLTEN